MENEKIRRLQAKAFAVARECGKRLKLDEQGIVELFDVTWQIIEAELQSEAVEAELKKKATALG